MKRLAVMAHFDYDGHVAPHVQRHVEALADAVDDLVVVSTADLTEESEAWLSEMATVLRRPNYGYDFLSYRTGLSHGGDLSAYDEVTVCNDSFVGPVVPYASIFGTMSDRPVDFWGYTHTERVAPHIQSFFVTFRPWVVRSKAFSSFWSDMIPLSDRRQVILRYEVGMSARLTEAGFRGASYFEENEHDRTTARRRVEWWALHRGAAPRSRSDLTRVRRHRREAWNPSIALADRVLDDARLPIVKIDTLRYDPYGLGAGRLLRRCEETYPEAFHGVRDWLEQTSGHYRPRAQEILRATPAPLSPLHMRVRY